MSMGRATCPLLWAAALRAAQPCAVSLTTGGFAPASLRYDRLTPVARVAGPRCSAGDPVLDCIPACLSPVTSMAPGDVCHGPRCSLAWLEPAALGYRPCCWPGGSVGSSQCARPMGCGLLLPVTLSPLVRTCARRPGPLGSCSPVCPLAVLCCVCGVLGHLAPVHQCALSVRCLACAVSWATWLLLTSVLARFIVLCLRCCGPLGSCSPVCLLVVLCCVCGVLRHLTPVHRCARSLCCVACAVSWATWLRFTGVLARFFVLFVRCPGPLRSCAPVCPLSGLCRVCAVQGHLAPVQTVCPPVVLRRVCGVLGHYALVHRCVGLEFCVACAVSWASWLLFTGVLAWCVAWRVYGVLAPLAPVHRCARSVCCGLCAVSWAIGSC